MKNIIAVSRITAVAVGFAFAVLSAPVMARGQCYEEKHESAWKNLPMTREFHALLMEEFDEKQFQAQVDSLCEELQRTGTIAGDRLDEIFTSDDLMPQFYEQAYKMPGLSWGLDPAKVYIAALVDTIAEVRRQQAQAARR